jgi:hypothetical protein
MMKIISIKHLKTFLDHLASDLICTKHLVTGDVVYNELEKHLKVILRLIVRNLLLNKAEIKPRCTSRVS